MKLGSEFTAYFLTDDHCALNNLLPCEKYRKFSQKKECKTNQNINTNVIQIL